MLVAKPEGLCTVSIEADRKTVTLGFHTERESQAFRDQVVDCVIETTQGPKRKSNGLNFTEEERQSAVAQTMIESLNGMREHAKTLRAWGAVEMAVIFETRAAQIEEEINQFLAITRGEKK